MLKTVPFQTIQFSISMQLVFFNLEIGPYQVLPFQTKVDLGAMAMKGYSANGSVRGVMITVVGNGHGDQSSSPGPG